MKCRVHMLIFLKLQIWLKKHCRESDSALTNTALSRTLCRLTLHGSIFSLQASPCLNPLLLEQSNEPHMGTSLQGWKFPHRFFKQFACLLWAKERKSDLLMKKSKSFLSLSCHEWLEGIAYSRSFVTSDLSESLTYSHSFVKSNGSTSLNSLFNPNPHGMFWTKVIYSVAEPEPLEPIFLLVGAGSQSCTF